MPQEYYRLNTVYQVCIQVTIFYSLPLSVNTKTQSALLFCAKRLSVSEVTFPLNWVTEELPKVAVLHPVFLKIKYTVAINNVSYGDTCYLYRTNLAEKRDKAGGTVTRLLLMNLPINVHADYEAEQQERKANHSPPSSAGSHNECSCIPNDGATNRNQNRLTIFDVDIIKYQT